MLIIDRQAVSCVVHDKAITNGIQRQHHSRMGKPGDLFQRTYIGIAELKVQIMDSFDNQTVRYRIAADRNGIAVSGLEIEILPALGQAGRRSLDRLFDFIMLK